VTRGAGRQTRAQRRSAVAARQERTRNEDAARLAQGSRGDRAWAGYAEAHRGIIARRTAAIEHARLALDREMMEARRRYDDAFDAAQAAYVEQVDRAWNAYLDAEGVPVAAANRPVVIDCREHDGEPLADDDGISPDLAETGWGAL
jgi:hypothetical protein